MNNIFEQLASNNSRIFKLSLLKEHKDNETLKKVIKLALDPFVNFYIRKIPEYTPTQPNQADSLDSVLDSLHNLYERKVTGNAGIEFLQKLLSSLVEEDAKVLERIIQKDLNCGVSTATVNAVWKNLIPTYPVMLCSGYDQKLVDKIEFPAYVQTKMDGCRVNVIVKDNSVEFRTRNGKELNFLGVFDKEFEGFFKDCVYDGELLVEIDGKIAPRKVGNGIISKAQKGTLTLEEAETVRVVLWDCITYDCFVKGRSPVPYICRWTLLSGLVEKLDLNKISLVDHLEVNSIEEATKIFNDNLDKGLEGIILKSKYGVWENKRSKNQIKFKAELDLEAEVIDWVEGSGKYTGMLGSLTCKHKDIEFNLGSGFTDEDRKNIDRSIIGKIVSVKYNEIITNKEGNRSLFLPIYLETRIDKDEI